MKPSEAIRQIMAIEGIRPFELAQALHVTNQSVNSLLTSPRISALHLADVVAAMGYQLVIVPDTADIPLDAFPIG